MASPKAVQWAGAAGPKGAKEPGAAQGAVTGQELESAPWSTVSTLNSLHIKLQDCLRLALLPLVNI